MFDKQKSEGAKQTRAIITLEIIKLSLKLGDSELLHEICLTSHTSGVTMVLGPNGAGKSLLLKCLHGLLKPSQGSFSLANAPDQATAPRQAMVFQKPCLLRRSVLENMEFVAPKRTKDTEILELLRKVHLHGKEKQPARLLSGGEQQRLSLARALITKPEILFLDEPTASLDPASVLIIEQLIKNAAENGVKSIFVSHDLGQAKRLGSDIIFLHQGRLIEHADAASFFTSPQSREARAYLDGEIVL